MTRSRLWTIIGGVALSLLAFVACGDDDSAGNAGTATTAASGGSSRTPAITAAGTSATGTPAATATAKPVTGAVNPCDLVTQSEAETASGVTLGPGQEEGVFPQTCTYIKAGGSTVTDPFVAIQYAAPMTDDMFEENVQAVGQPAEPIAGLGDKAYEAGGTYVLVGAQFVGLTVVLDNGSDEAAIQKDLAEIAVGRLP